VLDKTRDLIKNYEGPRDKVTAKADDEIEKILKESEERIKKQGTK